MKNKEILFMGALVALCSGAYLMSGVGKAYAYQGDPAKTGPYHTEEREVALDKIMSSKDFNAWKSFMTQDGRNPGVLSKIDTQAEFDKFAQAHILADSGKTAEANAIRAELGLGNGSRMGGGQRGNGECMR